MSCKEPELTLVCADLLMDLKNILSSVVGWSSNIAVHIEHLNQVPAKLEINEAVESIDSLIEDYWIIAAQRKVLLKRIVYLKSLKLTPCAT
jgi:hypothetical protein